MNTAQITAIEGTAGAGKTSFLSSLVDTSSFVFEEIYIGQNNQDSLLNRSMLYLEEEVVRSNKIQKIKSIYDRIYLDRSYISVAAYCYALSHYTKSSDDMCVYNIIFDQVISFLKKGSLLEPNQVIVLLCSPSTSLKRRRTTERDKYWPWFEPEFLNYLNQYYTCELERICTKAKIINTDNRSLLKVKGELQQILYGANKQ